MSESDDRPETSPTPDPAEDAGSAPSGGEPAAGSEDLGTGDGGGGGGAAERSSTGLDANIAALLANLLGPLSGLIFVLIEKESRLVKFHAWQALIFGGVYFIVTIALGFVPCVGWVLMLFLAVAVFVVWILMMVKAYQFKVWKLPVLGDFAEDQANR